MTASGEVQPDPFRSLSFGGMIWGYRSWWAQEMSPCAAARRQDSDLRSARMLGRARQMARWRADHLDGLKGAGIGPAQTASRPTGTRLCAVRARRICRQDRRLRSGGLGDVDGAGPREGVGPSLPKCLQSSRTSLLRSERRFRSASTAYRMRSSNGISRS